VVVTGTGIVDGLVLVVAAANEFGSTKRCIVGMVACDIDAALLHVLFKGVLSLKGFANTKGHLVGAVDVEGGMVDEKGAASKFLRFGLFAFCVSETSMSARHVLIDGDRLAGL
jgi:hypothetical protein